MIMFRILFSLACYCHHINLDKFCQDSFQKNYRFNTDRPSPGQLRFPFSEKPCSFQLWKPKKLCRGSPLKAEKTMTENQKAEKLVGAHRGRPPKADVAIPDKPKPSNRNKQ